MTDKADDTGASESFAAGISYCNLLNLNGLYARQAADRDAARQN